MKRAVITGATGAVGMALINELISHDVRLLLLCRPGSERNRHLPEHPNIRKICCALGQLAELKADTEIKYDVFFHLAWEGTTGAKREDADLQTDNIGYCLDAVRAAARLGCHTFIGAGSQAEYGRVVGKLRPDTPVFPETAYGIAKLCAGMMSRELAHQLGIRHIWTRILSVYGPYDTEESLIMSTIRKLLSGAGLKFTAGEQIWDYLYSSDAARALYLLGERGVDGKVYVLGSGRARPLKEYINEICRAAGKEAAVELGALPYGQRQVMYLCADISELQEDTAFSPRVEFTDGIRKILEMVT